MQARTTRRRSHASNRSGSRRVGRLRQAPMKSLLDRVPREVGVPEDEAGCRVQPRDEPPGEHGEGVMIAPRRALDEFPLVHDHPR